MEHETYLERHHELTTAALAQLHLLLGRGENDEAAAYLADVRSQTDALWEQRRQTAGRTVNK